MLELKNYNISKITNDYIYYNKEEEYIRVKITKSDLIELKSSLKSDIIFFNRMIKENNYIINDIQIEIEHLKHLNERRKQYIEKNQDNPLIRRGFSDICFNYDETEKEIYNLTHEMSGINRSNSKALYRLNALEKAFRQCKIIEIVKQGGVSDDCCEWHKQIKTYDYKPSCEPNSVFNVAGVGWFNYCPYCGKKIKVVE